VQGVVLISPYDSMVALARYHYPFLPVRWLLRHRFDSVARAPGIKAPLLAITGGHEDLGWQREFWGPIRAFLDTARAG